MNQTNNGTPTLDIVNPLNPNEIIKSEPLIKKNDINIEVTEESKKVVKEPRKEKKTKKHKKSFGLIIFLLLVLIALVGGYFVITKYDIFNNKKDSETNKDRPTEAITLNNIIDIFNDNVALYPLGENITANAELRENDIAVTINLDEQTLYYYFTPSNRNITATFLTDDDLGFNVTAYILSSIGKYYNTEFDKTLNYLKSKKDNLNNIEGLNVIELNGFKIITINMDNEIDITK